MPEQGGGGADRDPRGRVPAPGLIAGVVLCATGGLALLLAPQRTPSLVWPGESTDGLAALGWVGLGGVAAIAATRGGARRAVGLVLAAAGLAATAITVALAVNRLTGPMTLIGLTTPDTTTRWVWVSLAGALALVAAGTLTAVRGPRWPSLGARYDRTASPDDLWAALDRGEDPTDTIPG